MTRIKVEPPGPVHSVAELFAIAHALESAAASQYAETVRLLQQRGAKALADVFERLTATAADRVRQLEQRAKAHGGALPPDWKLPWPLPETFDMPPGEAGESRTLTPYSALVAAVHHEECIFAFWSYVAANTKRTDVRQAAEVLAHEQLQRVSLLRGERRKAFHEARQDRPSTGSAVTTLRDLETLERELASYFETCTGDRPQGAVPWQALASQAARMADRLHGIQNEFDLPGACPGFHGDVLATAEFLVEAYLRIADFGDDEMLVSAVQDLAAQAISRVADLRLFPVQA